VQGIRVLDLRESTYASIHRSKQLRNSNQVAETEISYLASCSSLINSLGRNANKISKNLSLFVSTLVSQTFIVESSHIESEVSTTSYRGEESEIMKNIKFESVQLEKMMYSVSEVAELLDISVSSVYRLVHSGQLAAVHPTEDIRITANALIRYGNQLEERARMKRCSRKPLR
jgi:excisionase family DNA binding protein